MDTYLLLGMVFNIFWYTNFVADEHGIMEFQFDLIWQPNADGSPQELADALVTEPVVLLNPGTPEDPRIIKVGDWYHVTVACRPFPPGKYWLNTGVGFVNYGGHGNRRCGGRLDF